MLRDVFLVFLQKNKELKHFLYDIIIFKKKMCMNECMNECGSEWAYDNIAAGAFENKFSKHHNNITIII